MTVLEASKGAIFMGWHLDYSESSTSRHLDKTGRELRYELREEEKERSQSAVAGRSGFSSSLASGEASSDYVGLKEPLG